MEQGERSEETVEGIKEMKQIDHEEELHELLNRFQKSSLDETGGDISNEERRQEKEELEEFLQGRGGISEQSSEKYHEHDQYREQDQLDEEEEQHVKIEERQEKGSNFSEERGKEQEKKKKKQDQDQGYQKREEQEHGVHVKQEEVEGKEGDATEKVAVEEAEYAENGVDGIDGEAEEHSKEIVAVEEAECAKNDDGNERAIEKFDEEEEGEHSRNKIEEETEEHANKQEEEEQANEKVEEEPEQDLHAIEKVKEEKEKAEEEKEKDATNEEKEKKHDDEKNQDVTEEENETQEIEGQKEQEQPYEAREQTQEEHSDQKEEQELETTVGPEVKEVQNQPDEEQDHWELENQIKSNIILAVDEKLEEQVIEKKISTDDHSPSANQNIKFTNQTNLNVHLHLSSCASNQYKSNSKDHSIKLESHPSRKLPQSTSIPKPLKLSSSLANIRPSKPSQPTNPLSIRSHPTSQRPPSAISPHPRISPSTSRLMASTTLKSLPPPALHSKPSSRSPAKTVSKSIGLQPPAKSVIKTSTTSSTKPPSFKPSQSSATSRTKPLPPSSTIPSRPPRTSTLTPSEPASIPSLKSTIKHSPSARPIKKSSSVTNKGHSKMPSSVKAQTLNPQIENTPPIEQSSQPSTKSSQAFREMLAQAKRNRSQLQNPTTSSNSDLIADPTDNVVPWELPPIQKVVEKAQRTGKLNASSRMMSKVPDEIYGHLLSHTSIFHPSNRPSTTHISQPVVDLNFSSLDDDQSNNPVAWHETVELTHLNLSLNELRDLDVEFGGFEALTRCDLHCNQLASLPYSFGLLVNLTVLNLSTNLLDQFPIPIMSLINLEDLDLSNNKLTQLWPLEWKPKLKSKLATALKLTSPSIKDDSLEGDQSLNSIDQPSTLGNSSFTLEEFSDQCSVLPTTLTAKFQDVIEEETQIIRRSNQQPFPNLKTLKLSNNKFTRYSLFGSDSVQLPINLVHLDLSNNPVGDGPIDVSNNLGNLKKLEKLYLRGCELQDQVFWVDPEGDFDELAGEAENVFFAELNELDLSQNSIDSLGPLEIFFDANGSNNHDYRILDYQGLPSELVKIVQPHRATTESGSGPVLKVIIRDNFLRQEAKRRRKLHAMQLVNTGQDQSSKTPVLEAGADSTKLEPDKPEVGEELKDVLHEKNIVADHLQSLPATAATSQVQTKRNNPTEALLIKNFNLATLTINLEGLQLSELPDDQEVYHQMIIHQNPNFSKAEIINLCNNRLTQVPIELIFSFANLTILNLSRNRLVNNDGQNLKINNLLLNFKENNSQDQSLSQLIELNLSSNFFTGSPQFIVDLIIKCFKCFNLKILDLRFNRFENLNGLLELLNLHQLNQPSHQNPHDPISSFKIEKLLLDGNQINQIDDLIDFAAQTRANFLHLFPSPSLRKGAEVADSIDSELFIHQIGLSDNSIPRLPYVLGFLPTKKLDIARNVFRFPSRKVYDCPGGNTQILNWLRERASSDS